MATTKSDIYVYAHWAEMTDPKCIGVLTAQQAKSKKAFSFEYDRLWLQSEEQRLIDPEISWFGGPQYPQGKENFGVFMDSMPDTWGRTLMKRRAALVAKEIGKTIPVLYDIDFLLGVLDETRMGALRFKKDPAGPFLDNNANMPAPPWTHIRDLQYGASVLESDSDDKEIKKWLSILIAPGSSLGGARPKANISDDKGYMWIAKFPSSADTVDKGAWEYVAYLLAKKSGISMPECKLQKVTGRHHTFFTKRFDRKKKKRIHFASSMTMTGQSEDTLKTSPASYLDLAEFIQFNGAQNKDDLKELWRRIIFHIAISNTDDHLRNHGFILTANGWILSPAFDINPSIDKDGLAINIDSDNNDLDIELARSVGEYFSLSPTEMNVIVGDVKSALKNWQALAKVNGISRTEIDLMNAAFRL